MRAANLLCAGLLLASSACAREWGELVVVVSSDLAVPAELDGLSVTLRDPSGAVVDARIIPLVSKRGDLVTSFSVAPKDDDPSRAVDLEVDAMHGSERLFGTRTRTRFLTGRRLELDVFLAAACRAKACGGDTPMCLRGQCSAGESVDPSALADYLPPTPAPDGGVQTDTGPTDSGPTDGPTDADGGGADGGGVDADGGSVDTGPTAECALGATVVLARDHEPTGVAVASDGAEVGVAWIAGVSQLELERRDAAGARLAHLEVVPAAVELGALRMVSTGSSGYALAWSERAGAHSVVRLALTTSSTLAWVRTLTEPGDDDAMPAVAFGGGGIGLARQSLGYAGRFTRSDPSGAPATSGSVALPAEYGLEHFALAYDEVASAWVVAVSAGLDWSGGAWEAAYHVVSSADEARFASPRPFLTSPSTWRDAIVPSLALGERGMTQRAWAAAWVDDPATNQVFFARVDLDGQAAFTAPVGLTAGAARAQSGWGPALAWHPTSGYLVATRESGVVHLAHLVGSSFVTQDLGLPANELALAATEAGYVLAWTDDTGVRLAAITCP